MKIVPLLLMLIPYVLFSQNISITLTKEQWNDIKATIEQEENLRGLVADFEKALSNSKKIEAENKKIIANLRLQNKLLIETIENKEAEISNLKRIYDVDTGLLRDKANKRIGIGFSVGMGYGTESRQPQIILGIGINYTLIKL